MRHAAASLQRKIGHPQRHFVLPLAASGLLLLALVEAVFAGRDASEVVFITLFGAPATWFLARVGKRIIGKIDKADLFSPLVAFPVAYAFWFGVGSLTFVGGASPPPYRYLVLGILAYFGGAAAFNRSVPRIRGGKPPRGPRWDPSRFRLAVLGFSVLMVTAYVVLIAQVGIPAIHEDVAYRRMTLSHGHSYALAVFQSAATTVILFCAADLWSATRRLLSPTVSTSVATLSGVLLVSFGNRGFLIIPLLTAIILRHYWKKPIPVGRLALLLALLFLGAVGYGYARDGFVSNGFVRFGWERVMVSSPAFMLHTNLATLRDVVATIPAQVPYQHGYLTFGVLLQTLPGHHESSDRFFRRILGSEFVGGGQPATLLGPLYGDFGVAGVLLGMFVFGAVSVTAYRCMLRTRTLFAVLVYAWLAQDALLSLYGALVTYIVTLWLPLLWWMAHRWMSAASETAGARNSSLPRSAEQA